MAPEKLLENQLWSPSVVFFWLVKHKLCICAQAEYTCAMIERKSSEQFIPALTLCWEINREQLGKKYSCVAWFLTSPSLSSYSCLYDKTSYTQR